MIDREHRSRLSEPSDSSHVSLTQPVPAITAGTKNCHDDECTEGWLVCRGVLITSCGGAMCPPYVATIGIAA